MVPDRFDSEVLGLVSPRLAALVRCAVRLLPAPLEELRIRQDRALQLVMTGRDSFVAVDGGLTADPARAVTPTADDLSRTFQLMARGSVYAWEDEVRTGFLTLPGGHRVGLAGRAVTEEGRLRTFRDVAALNVRVAREVRGCAAGLLPRLVRRGRVLSTLLVSPPQAGKTTVLRDLVRLISEGVPAAQLPGRKVALVDERSEVAGCQGGVPQRDLGPRTDVLDGCPKAEGLMLAIRSLSPDVAAVDEIGRPADGVAVMEALHAGVTVLATAHGFGPADLQRRPALAELIEVGAFERIVVLGRSRGPGTVEAVYEPGGERGAGQDGRSALDIRCQQLDRVADC